MTSQIHIVNYNTSANNGQALPSRPSLLHLLPACLDSVGSECRALSFPSTSARAGLDAPAEDHAPHQEGNQEEPHSAAALVDDRGLPPRGMGSDRWEPPCGHHHPGWESPLLHTVSCWCSSILSCWQGAALGFHRHFQPPTAPAATVLKAGLLALLQLCGSH